ncbi:MAG: class I SAM-dependent methyltransferase [Deltaproteobacteria bacterium]|nr:class I SAM-dependent methyltransferase [Deltaproteobacteria bacterium]
MKIEPFEIYTQKYEDWFDKNRFAFESELQAIKNLLPPKKMGIEIGVGTGRFAVPLGIGLGVEPSPKMGEIAVNRGIKVVKAGAESLPFNDETFDFVLMVTTLCFIDDVGKAFDEIYRILKRNGYFINGFVDKKSRLGKLYEKHKQKSVFYRIAQFYSTDEVIGHLKIKGFKNFDFRETIFHNLSEIKNVEPATAGYGQGSFVIIKAQK